jgi:hypothetical protein
MNNKISLIKYAIVQKENFQVDKFFQINGKLFDDKKIANKSLVYNEDCIVIPVKVTYDFDMKIN